MIPSHLLAESWRLTRSHPFLWLFTGFPVFFGIIFLVLLQQQTIGPLMSLYQELQSSSKIDTVILQTLQAKLQTGLFLLLPFLFFFLVVTVILLTSLILAVHGLSKGRHMTFIRSVRLGLPYFFRTFLLVSISGFLFFVMLYMSHLVADLTVAWLYPILCFAVVVIMLFSLLFAFHVLILRGGGVLHALYASFMLSLQDRSIVVLLLGFKLVSLGVYLSLLGFAMFLGTYIHPIIGIVFATLLTTLWIPLTAFLGTLWTLGFLTTVKNSITHRLTTVPKSL